MDIISKYKVESFNDFLGYGKITSTLKIVAHKKKIPHIMLYGPNGCGKSKLIDLFIKETKIDIKDIYHVNLDNDFKKKNIETGKLMVFLKNTRRNMVIIDNVSKIDISHQYILKSLIKNFNKNTTFIISLNNMNNMLEHLSSNFIIFKMNNNKGLYLKYMNDIIEKEGLKLDENIIQYITDTSNSFNIMINNFVVYLNIYKTHTYSNITDKQISEKIISFSKNKDVFKLIQYVDEILETGVSVIDIINILLVHIDYDGLNVEYAKTLMAYRIEENLSYISFCSLMVNLTALDL